MTRRSPGLAAKLIVALSAGLLLSFGVLGWMHLRIQRAHLEASSIRSAERINEVIRRSAHDLMLRNDVSALYRLIRTIGDDPGIVRIRIYNQLGRISYSSDTTEVGRHVDTASEACSGCHEKERPPAIRAAHFRHLESNQDGRVLALIQPIRNEPACSRAPCHAHPADLHVLGVLDTQLSMQDADRDLAAVSRSIVLWLVLALVVVGLVSSGFLELFVFRRLSRLKAVTERVASGDLDAAGDIARESGSSAVSSRAPRPWQNNGDELDLLARSLDAMVHEVRGTRNELTRWNETLEARVAEKTRELEQAHEHLVRVERLASVGKLAAIVAHEINNPLTGIRTYAKLLKRRYEGDATDASEILGTIESESARCGDIVRNLLQFSRPRALKLETCDPAELLRRSVRLVQHQIDLQSMDVEIRIDEGLPAIECDAQQIAQMLVALLMNALEAAREGGHLSVAATTPRAVRSAAPESEPSIEIVIADNGVGMDAETRRHAFEPFFTTKEETSGTGLGLAVVYGIVTRHHGEIALDSTPMLGTTVTLRLPLRQPATEERGTWQAAEIA